MGKIINALDTKRKAVLNNSVGNLSYLNAIGDAIEKACENGEFSVLISMNGVYLDYHMRSTLEGLGYKIKIIGEYSPNYKISWG